MHITEGFNQARAATVAVCGESGVLGQASFDSPGILRGVFSSHALLGLSRPVGASGQARFSRASLRDLGPLSWGRMNGLFADPGPVEKMGSASEPWCGLARKMSLMPILCRSVQISFTG